MKKVALPVLVVAACALLLIVFVYRNTRKEIVETNQHIKSFYWNISFRGKIDRIHRIRRGGRTYAMACIKLDYSSINELYRFNKKSCLKIKNNIATLPLGFIGERPTEEAQFMLQSYFIEVNINNSGKLVFFKSNGELLEKDLYYGSNNLIEADMTVCGGL